MDFRGIGSKLKRMQYGKSLFGKSLAICPVKMYFTNCAQLLFFAGMK